MGNQTNGGSAGGRGALDTSAQNGTGISGRKAVILYGRGSELGDAKIITNKAKRKIITETMAITLVDIARKRGDLEKAQKYWNTYHCQSRLYTHDGRTYGKYCKNRHCTVCNSIRKAVIIEKYYPVLKEWKEGYLVTLTVKACKAAALRSMLRQVLEKFRQIIAKLKKQHQRGKGIKVMGVRSLECNFNPKDRTYNPHLHIIVPDKATANLLMSEWLHRWGVWKTSGSGQHKRRVKDLEHDMVEMIKYGSKIFTEPDVHKKSATKKGDRDIYAAALYNIFEAMKGLRLFERFGFNLSDAVAKRTPSAPQVTTDFKEWHYDIHSHDWVNEEDGDHLSGYRPPPLLVELLDNHINTGLE